MRTIITLSATLIASIALARGAIADPTLPSAVLTYDASMPRDQQVELALSAAPDGVAAHATAYVLGPNGYEKAREGTNGVSCLVQRSPMKNGETSVAPMCFDVQGSTTMMLVYMRKEALRDEGKSDAEIKADIDRGYADGRFRAPTRPGVIYMMSCFTRLGPDASGNAESFPPHLMLYAAYMTAKDLGYDGTATVPALVMAGSPEAMMVVIPGAPQQRKCPSSSGA